MADLVTDAEVTAAWPGFAKLDAGERAALISDASAAIEDWCRRTFAVAGYAEALSGANRPRVWLANLPVVSVESVSINGRVLDNADGSAWTVTPATGELLRGDGRDDPRLAPWFPVGRGNVAVAYTAGYAATPGPVRRAAIMSIKNLVESLKTSVGPIRSESVGDYAYTLGDPSTFPLPAIALGLLARYVREDVA